MVLSPKTKWRSKPRRPSGLGLLVLVAPVIISLLYVNMALTVADGLLIKPEHGEIAGIEPEPDATSSRQRLVLIDRTRLVNSDGKPAERIPLNLFQNVFFTAVLDQAETGQGGLAWKGHLDAVPNSRVMFVLRDRSLTGDIFYPGVGFSVVYLKKGLHLIKEIKPDHKNLGK